MGFSAPKYDPSGAEANPRLNLTKEEVAGYQAYRNQDRGPFQHIQTIDEWAKENHRGVYGGDPTKPPPDLVKDPGLKPGETFTGYKPDLVTKTSDGGAPPTPSLTDSQLDGVRQSQLLMMKSGRGRGSTFLTGPTGLTNAPDLGRSVLPAGGYGPKLGLTPGGNTAAGKPGRTLLGR